MERVVLHSDMNNFFASVECLYCPELWNQPMAVGGDVEARHGIILAKNQVAKKYGIQTGEAIWQARQKCRELVVVPPHFDRYVSFSNAAKEIYTGYTDQVEAFGLDECWLDVTGSTSLFGDGLTIANEIRARIKTELGITASIGVSFNKVFAKLGSDYKKPDATTVISRDNYKELVWTLPVEELLYVGPATKGKLNRYGVYTIGDLAKSKADFLRCILGKVGIMLWQFANGADTSGVSPYYASPMIKSVGNSTTTPRDLMTDDDLRITLFALCESVSARLREQRSACSTVQIGIRNSRGRFFCVGGLNPLRRKGFSPPTRWSRPLAFPLGRDNCSARQRATANCAEHQHLL